MRDFNEREAKALELLVSPEGPKFEILRRQAAVAKVEDTVDSTGSFSLWVPRMCHRSCRHSRAGLRGARHRTGRKRNRAFMLLLWCKDGALHWVECISSHDLSLTDLDTLDGLKPPPNRASATAQAKTTQRVRHAVG